MSDSLAAVIPDPKVVPAELESVNRPLASLSAEAAALLEPHLVQVRLRPGETLHGAGLPATHVYFPHGGMICLSAMSAEGDPVHIETVGRRGAIGINAALGAPAALNRATVYLPAIATRIEAESLGRLAHDHTAIREFVNRLSDMCFLAMQQAYVCLALHPVQERLCRVLLQARDHLGSSVLPLTQEFVAEILGVQRTTVTLVTGVLQNEHILHTRRGRVEILDPAALEARVCSCYAAMRRTLELGSDRTPLAS